MTIEMKIKNNDSRESAIVSVQTQDNSGQATNTGIQLKGGEETTAYVHSGQKILIEEIQNG